MLQMSKGVSIKSADHLAGGSAAGSRRQVYLGAALALIISLAAGRSEASEKFGGVEIGAKGVKAAAIEVVSSVGGATLKVLELKKATTDVTISRLKGKNFADVRIEDVAQVVADFIKVLQTELGVPTENIQVVASSGVPFANNFPDLVTAVRERTGKDLDQIDAREEGTLTTLALVPKDLRTKILVIDIGAGNTKGGTFLDDSGMPERFLPLSLPFGTTTLSQAIDAKAAGDAPRADVARELAQEVVGTPLRKQVDENRDLVHRELVLFSGGSVWAFITIMKPETTLNPFPVVTADDIKAYGDLLRKTPGAYPQVDFARVKDPQARKVAEADYSRICGTSGGAPTFRPDELQAGAALLEQVSDALNFPEHTVYFDRKAVTAWITARITPAAYLPLLPQALGRKFPFVTEKQGRDQNPGKGDYKKINIPETTSAVRGSTKPPVYASGQTYASPQCVLIPSVPSKEWPTAFPTGPTSSQTTSVAMPTTTVATSRRPARASRESDAADAVKAFGAGYDLYWTGHPAEALAAFQAAVDLSRDDARFWYFKGLAESALGDTQSAEASIWQAARFQKQNLPDARSIGMALVRVQGPTRQYINEMIERVEVVETVARSR